MASDNGIVIRWAYSDNLVFINLLRNVEVQIPDIVHLHAYGIDDDDTLGPAYNEHLNS